MAYMFIRSSINWALSGTVTDLLSATRYYLDLFWLIVDWNKLKWYLNQNPNMTFEINVSKYVVCKMATILFRPQYIENSSSMCGKYNVYEKYRLWTTLIARFMGPTWGPSGSCRPHVGPMNLAIWEVINVYMMTSWHGHASCIHQAPLDSHTKGQQYEHFVFSVLSSCKTLVIVYLKTTISRLWIVIHL